MTVSLYMPPRLNRRERRKRKRVAIAIAAGKGSDRIKSGANRPAKGAAASAANDLNFAPWKPWAAQPETWAEPERHVAAGRQMTIADSVEREYRQNRLILFPQLKRNELARSPNGIAQIRQRMGPQQSLDLPKMFAEPFMHLLGELLTGRPNCSLYELRQRHDIASLVAQLGTGGRSLCA
jgi:hypothetical protein